ncbi:hypothetical protein ACP4OV_007064 [Aristida adscensionis]
MDITLMLDEDDDVEPRFKAVDEYYFEDGKDKPICFSTLPFRFDDIDEVKGCDSEKKVYLRGVADSLQVHARVVAWRVEFDREQPSILVLSSEGNCIRLLKSRKWYEEKIARSILITVQMLHFVRKQHGDKRSLWGCLWDHLDKVFKKLGTKPAMDDLTKNYDPLIKLFLEKDPILMRSKILKRFNGDATKKTQKRKITGTKVKSTYSDDPRASNSDDGDCDSSDDSAIEDDSNDDDNGAGNTDNDGTDALCAFCDDGGNLLSCVGQCKRSFHPRKKDGRESNCKTLGFTSAQLKGIVAYLCKSCEYKQHQCFKCGELDPSCGPNAKVFKCNNPSCGHFYHPKCVAKLLEPDGSELAKEIMGGLQFTCPVHWCFKCKRMEDRTQGALQFAVCRRCPKSYHTECLPRRISFETKEDVKQRAWELSKVVMIYCLDHEICTTTGNARRGHIKFPSISKMSKVRDVGKKGSNRLRKQKKKYIQRAVAHASLGHTVLKPERSATHLKGDLLIEQSIVGAASLTENREALKEQEEQLSQIEKRRRSENETSHNIAKKCGVPSKDIFDRAVRQTAFDNNTLIDNDAGWVDDISKIPEDEDFNQNEKSSEHCSTKGFDTNHDTSSENTEQRDVLGKHFVDKGTDGARSKLKSRKESAMEKHKNAYVHDSISGKDEEISRKRKQICPRMREQDPRSDKLKIAGNDCNKSISGNSDLTPDHVDENPPEIQLHVPPVDQTTITDRIGTQQELGCSEGQEVCGNHFLEEEANSSPCKGYPKGLGVDMDTSGAINTREPKEKATDVRNADLDMDRQFNHIEDGKEVHYDDHYQCPSNHKRKDDLDSKLTKTGFTSLQCNDESKVAEISENESMQNAGSSRREDLMHNIRENSSLYPMGSNSGNQPMNPSTGPGVYHDMFERHPITNNQQIYQQHPNVNYSSNGYYEYDTRRRDSLPSAFPGPHFGAEQRPVLYPRGPEHGIPGWQSHPVCPRGPGYFPTGWHSPPFYPTRPQPAPYTMDHNNLHNFNGYNAAGVAPASRPSLPVNNYGAHLPHQDVSVGGYQASHGGHNSAYGLRSNYVFGWGPRAPAAGSVTDKYAPNLEQTNYQPRGWPMHPRQ